LIPKGIPVAKAATWIITDVEGRKHRYQMGLETPVVYAANDGC